jgi:hypothetical protein
MFSVPAIWLGWFAMMPTERPSMRANPITMFGAYSGCTSTEVAVVDDALDDRVHVVGLVRRVGDDRVELAVVVGDLELDSALVDRGIRHVVVGQERDERARVVERVDSSLAR